MGTFILHRPLRLAVASAIAVVSLAVAGGSFWYADWRYALPTPRPAHVRCVLPGDDFDAPPELRAVLSSAAGRPVLLHFFNPDCPCSRFNIDHVRDVIAEFGDRVRWIAVLQNRDARRARSAFGALHLKSMTAISDVDGGIAEALGVYSTPQAVVLDRQHRVYYRGNYNINRYCTDPRTDFARRALAGAVAGVAPPEFGSAATAAYGCELPVHAETAGSR